MVSSVLQKYKRKSRHASGKLSLSRRKLQISVKEKSRRDIASRVSHSRRKENEILSVSDSSPFIVASQTQMACEGSEAQDQDQASVYNNTRCMHKSPNSLDDVTFENAVALKPIKSNGNTDDENTNVDNIQGIVETCENSYYTKTNDTGSFEKKKKNDTKTPSIAKSSITTIQFGPKSSNASRDMDDTADTILIETQRTRTRHCSTERNYESLLPTVADSKLLPTETGNISGSQDESISTPYNNIAEKELEILPGHDQDKKQNNKGSLKDATSAETAIPKCIICEMTFEAYTILEQQQHMNVCIDDSSIDPIKRHRYSCIICSKDMSISFGVPVTRENITSRLDHIKKCALQHGVNRPSELRKSSNKKTQDSQSDSDSSLSDGNIDDLLEEMENSSEGDLNELLEEMEDQNEDNLGELLAEMEKKGKSRKLEAEKNPKENAHLYLMANARRAATTERALKGKGNVNDVLMAHARRQRKKPWKSYGKKKGFNNSLTTGHSSTANSYKADPPRHKQVPGTGFVVDGFKYYGKHYFLTHFHSDHYGGLYGKSFEKGKLIYCTPITARLIQLKLKVKKQQIKQIQIGETIIVRRTSITAIEANHCPGAAMFLFRVQSTGHQYLHTGDFRYERTKVQLPTNIFPLTNIYLDTTYCDPKYVFPPVEMVLQNACSLAKKYASSENCLVLFGTYSIGKEQVFMRIIQSLGADSFICVSKEKYATLQCLGDYFSLKEWAKFTVDKRKTRFHVVPMTHLKKEFLAKRLKSSRIYDKIVAFRPTGWSKTTSVTHDKTGRVTLISIPYSEHSSFNELKHFVQDVRQRQSGASPVYIATVTNMTKNMNQLGI